MAGQGGWRGLAQKQRHTAACPPAAAQRQTQRCWLHHPRHPPPQPRPRLQKACLPPGATSTKHSSVWSCSGLSCCAATGSTVRTRSACSTSCMYRPKMSCPCSSGAKRRGQARQWSAAYKQAAGGAVQGPTPALSAASLHSRPCSSGSQRCGLPGGPRRRCAGPAGRQRSGSWCSACRERRGDEQDACFSAVLRQNASPGPAAPG